MTSLQGLVPRGLASAQALKIRVKGPGPTARVPPLHPSSWHPAQPPGPWQLRRPLLPGTKSRAFTGHLSKLCLRAQEPWAAGAHRGPGCAPCPGSPVCPTPGQRGRRERGPLPLLPEALHGPASQGRALHTHHCGHPQVPGGAEGLRPRLPAAHPALRRRRQNRHAADRGVSGGDVGAPRVRAEPRRGRRTGHPGAEARRGRGQEGQRPGGAEARRGRAGLEGAAGSDSHRSPSRFPSLAPRYRESAAAGNDVFHKFSAFIKNPVPTQDDGEGLEARRGWGERRPGRPSPGPSPSALYQQLLRALAKLDSYLRAPLEHELGREPQLRESRRRFLDGDQLTLADCGLLPKLHVVNTVCAHFRQAPIPAELRGVRRYLDCALQEKEFKYTCPHSAEILAAYRPVVRPR
ncbi:chloride intracellular channel protein 3 isoform X2 [Ovis canadensis]|uniref:chloride intracellular channel protein 3 isoform X2 n=1 Tax=Ovis canadensis TaxID=37174 RepID=UPI003751AE7A